MPYAFAPLVLSVLLSRQHGLYSAFFVSLWSSMLFGPIDAPLLITSLISGFTAVSLTLQVRRRSRLIRAGFFVGLAIWFLSLTFGLIGPINWFYPTANDWGMVGVQSALAVGNGIVTAMIVGGALPMLENLFGITTDISWLEASDLNHPLLRRMTIEAPGTYHHSLVVANLAEAAAEAVGANATLCRVCSYFHDVGPPPRRRAIASRRRFPSPSPRAARQPRYGRRQDVKAGPNPPRADRATRPGKLRGGRHTAEEPQVHEQAPLSGRQNPGAGRGPRIARSSRRASSRHATGARPPAASGCFSAASSGTGASRSAARSSTSRKKTPGGVLFSGSPAELSISISQRRSSAATRRASSRSGVTSAAVAPGVSSLRRSSIAMVTASCWALAQS